jgi:hypothetical protein
LVKGEKNMKPNAQQLALRDPALAALMGVSALGADFGAEFGDPDPDPDIDEFGDPDLDDDMGAEFGGSAMVPSSQQLVKMWHLRRQRALRSAARIRHLDPNRGSSLKVERYCFSISQTITIGTASALTLQGNPDTTFRPQELVVNVPTPGFATLDQIRCANVSIMVGPNAVDAWMFNANSLRSHLDLPTLTPANRATLTGSYTGFEGGYPSGLSYALTAAFTGPASVAGGAAI